MEKLIITAALTGGMHGKQANPALPEQPGEIVDAAVECWNAGASIVHLHARDAVGRGVAELDIFREINEGIRSRCPLLIQDTTGDAGIPVAQRILSLDTGPDMASLNMGTVVFFVPGPEGVEEVDFVNRRSEIEAFAVAMLERGIKPEMEVYSPAMFGEVENLIEKELVRQPYYVNFVMGVGGMGGYPGTPRNLNTMIDHLPEGAKFNVSGIGKAQLPMSAMAILTGGHARVGLEDNIYYRRGELASSNAQLVERVVRLAAELGRDIASPEDARAILAI